MPTCIIDGKKIEFQEGDNLVQAAKRGGIEIPVFCYHPGLTVVAQCRICTVEIEKMPKVQTACSTAARDGMVVQTQSAKVKKARQSVMEFLLINHPLDCPICDKSGECDLQDFSYEHGSAYQRYTEERRTYMDLDMGPVIQKNMNRCIHCTRCIRFGDEVAHIREMVALKRSNNTEITTIDGKALETDYAGNYSDICPTGSLTLKDFRFNKRAWMLKKTPSICEGCSRGCNMEIQWDNDVIHRCIPRENLEVNRYWLCDEGRFHFRDVQNEHRQTEPGHRVGKDWNLGDWSATVQEAKRALNGKKVVVLVGSDLTNEEMKMIREFAPAEFGISESDLLHFGTPGISTTRDDGDEDSILKRKSKTSNLNGAEKLGLKPFKNLPSGADAAVVFRGGRAVLPKLSGVKTIGVGVFHQTEIDTFDAVLPGVHFAEKEGTVVNSQGMEQKLQRAVKPPRSCKALSEILMLWSHGGSKRETA